MPKSREPTRRPSRRLRCAIYTRKSSDEGLEQAFNSLDAQREACAAFVLSQKHEGWSVLPTLYDDGGYSGGTLDRPALQRLLADIADAKVDVVVVYKIDRLTRSLFDFAKIVEAFDARGVSFVSITQQFNTTTSMGRLTLNVLLSFAQFEREVAGERIRDKIAASKKKGMWMGGLPPLGYDVRDRKLVVNQEEAKTVLHIFRRYVELRSVRALKVELDAAGIRSKRRTFADGTVYGGHKLSRGALYLMLQNRIYRGEITHKGNAYPGEHKAIVDKALWDKVQAVLAENRVDRTTGADAKYPSLLAGLAFDDSGERLTPTHAVKKGTRYRYYVSKSLITGAAKDHSQGRRIPAGNLESLVIGRLRAFLADEGALLSAIGDARGERSRAKETNCARPSDLRGAPYAHTGRDTIHSPDARQPYRYQSGARRDQSVSAPASRPAPGTVVGTVFGRPGPCEPPRRYSETQGEGATPARRPRDEAGRAQRRGSGGMPIQVCFGSLLARTTFKSV